MTTKFRDVDRQHAELVKWVTKVVHSAKGSIESFDTIPLARTIQCAVTRRHSSAGANPARQLSLQPVAVGADDGGNDIG